MSQLHQDPVSGDWVIIASERAKRPDELIKPRAPRKPGAKQTCPFEDFEKSGNPVISAWPNVKNWRIAVIPNKYPALTHADVCAVPMRDGIYTEMAGVGNHELVIGRDHNKNFAEIDLATATKVFETFQERFRVMAKDDCLSYVSAFANWGSGAGASLWHPHYQLIALPVVPPRVAHSLDGSEKYFKKHKRCARCDVVRTEKKQKIRVIAENARAIAIAPYAGKRPFEVMILPKPHLPAFEKTPTAVLRDVAAVTQRVLGRMRARLHDPDYNLFVHSAPIDGKSYAHHHWHIEIVPVNVISPPGGFEISTIININVIDPAKAAAILRK